MMQEVATIERSCLLRCWERILAELLGELRAPVVEVGIVGHRCGEGGDQVAGTIQLATVYRGFERERLLDKCCCVPAGRRGAIKGHHVAEDQIGRASCRERGCQSV